MGEKVEGRDLHSYGMRASHYGPLCERLVFRSRLHEETDERFERAVQQLYRPLQASLASDFRHRLDTSGYDALCNSLMQVNVHEFGVRDPAEETIIQLVDLLDGKFQTEFREKLQTLALRSREDEAIDPVEGRYWLSALLSIAQLVSDRPKFSSGNMSYIHDVRYPTDSNRAVKFDGVMVPWTTHETRSQFDCYEFCLGRHLEKDWPWSPIEVKLTTRTNAASGLDGLKRIRREHVQAMYSQIARLSVHFCQREEYATTACLPEAAHVLYLRGGILPHKILSLPIRDDLWSLRRLDNKIDSMVWEEKEMDALTQARRMITEQIRCLEKKRRTGLDQLRSMISFTKQDEFDAFRNGSMSDKN